MEEKDAKTDGSWKDHIMLIMQGMIGFLLIGMYMDFKSSLHEHTLEIRSLQLYNAKRDGEEEYAKALQKQNKTSYIYSPIEATLPESLSFKNYKNISLSKL